MFRKSIPCNPHGLLARGGIEARQAREGRDSVGPFQSWVSQMECCPCSHFSPRSGRWPTREPLTPASKTRGDGSLRAAASAPRATTSSRAAPAPVGASSMFASSQNRLPCL